MSIIVNFVGRLQPREREQKNTCAGNSATIEESIPSERVLD